MVTDVIPLLLRVTRILDDLGVRYVVGGSLASGIHGELRATNDIDVMIELPVAGVSAFVAALKPEFDIGEDTVRAAVTDGRSFGALHVERHVKVDFFPAGESALDERELERRRPLRLPAEPSRAETSTSPRRRTSSCGSWIGTDDPTVSRTSTPRRRRCAEAPAGHAGSRVPPLHGRIPRVDRGTRSLPGGRGARRLTRTRRRRGREAL